MRMLLLAVVVLVSSVDSSGAGFCAVKVLVTDGAGKPATASVKLVDSRGEVVRQASSANGSVEFCDFGFGDHYIEIGASTCAHIIIPHVRVLFGRTQLFRVYNNQCTIGDVSLIGCASYFRVTAPSGEGLPRVTITSEPAGVRSETDDYGRAQINIDSGESRLLEFSKAGFVPIHIELNCPKPKYAEQSVMLKPIER